MVMAVAYLASTVARWRFGEWRGAATLAAAFLAAAVFQKLDRQWVASALVIEAELFYLAGLRLRAAWRAGSARSCSARLWAVY